MKQTTKLLGMTAAVALLSAPAMAEKVYYIDTDLDGQAEFTITGETETNVFAKLDTNDDGLISRQEFYDNTLHEEEAEVFALYDSNQDEVITPTELYTNSKWGNGRLTDSYGKKYQSTSGQKIGSMRTKFYTDSKRPTYEVKEYENQDEIVAKPIYFVEPAKPNQTTFQRLDDDNNGVISQTEFMRNTIHDNEAAIFAMFDKNQNGVISEYELKTYEKTGGRR